MKVRRFAVIGDPVGHSKSPVMQGAAMRVLGLPHTYEAVRTTAAELPQIVAALREGTFDGLNVTVPHKERVLSLVDALDESARVAGAANTLVRQSDGRIVAHNTDAPALAAEIARLRPSAANATDATDAAATANAASWPRGARGLVLGSGGAARAAIVALGSYLGLDEVVVRARSFADPVRREAFLATAPLRVTLETWDPSASGEATTVAIVQATSAGMRGADPGDEVAGVVAWDALPHDAVAIDVVYAPRDTPWLRAARGRGLACDDGLGMLARQGGLALELWLAGESDPSGAGPVRAPFDAMRAALE
jgi:shikimate dehydrogenase